MQATPAPNKARPDTALPAPFRHCDFIRSRSAAGAVALPQFVQIKRGQVTQCARIVDAWTTSDGVDLWSVLILETSPPTSTSVKPSRTRQCSGLDGRCVCAGEAV